MICLCYTKFVTSILNDYTNDDELWQMTHRCGRKFQPRNVPTYINMRIQPNIECQPQDQIQLQTQLLYAETEKNQIPFFMWRTAIGNILEQSCWRYNYALNSTFPTFVDWRIKRTLEFQICFILYYNLSVTWPYKRFSKIDVKSDLHAVLRQKIQLPLVYYRNKI